ncbi:MAG: hypothetical protein F4213_12115 [Boseongicola sp. SB0677_bin_26]|nr:hypothetical protein [Boseongicola sp. SB0677_bin_26]
MDGERRYSGAECRAEGRTLIGPAIRYDDVSRTFRERFLPGAFDLDSKTRYLDLRHNKLMAMAWTNGGGLELVDSAEMLMVKATLPDIPVANLALRELAAGRLTGFSIDFVPLKRTKDAAGLRTVHRAELNGVGLVDKPSYPQSTVEVRAKAPYTLSGKIPLNKPLTCRCHRGTCDRVRFTEAAFDDAIAGDDEILLITGEFESALASKARRSLTLRKTDDAIEVDARLPDTTAAADLAARSRAVDLLTRPVFDQELSEFTEADGLATYTKVHVKAVLVGASNVEGWPAATVRGKSARRSALRLL